MKTKTVFLIWFAVALGGLITSCDSQAENGDDMALTANIKDNLGAMYNKHQLFEEALAMHRSAIADFKEINDSIGMMIAWRNCGRTTKSLELFAQTKAYYDSAFHIAALLRDTAMTNDLYLEIGRDYYMKTIQLSMMIR